MAVVWSAIASSQTWSTILLTASSASPAAFSTTPSVPVSSRIEAVSVLIASIKRSNLPPSVRSVCSSLVSARIASTIPSITATSLSIVVIVPGMVVPVSSKIASISKSVRPPSANSACNSLVSAKIAVIFPSRVVPVSTSIASTTVFTAAIAVSMSLSSAGSVGKLSVLALIASTTVSAVSILPSIVASVAGIVVAVSSTIKAVSALIAANCASISLSSAGSAGRLSVFALIASISMSSLPPFVKSVCSSFVSARIAATSVSKKSSMVVSAAAVASPFCISVTASALSAAAVIESVASEATTTPSVPVSARIEAVSAFTSLTKAVSACSLATNPAVAIVLMVAVIYISTLCPAVRVGKVTAHL
ncbi:MAG: hypothetical protein BWY95_02627 [Bacteroidetes bacterium ADurb.BinA104]|nr:MAG: hypothetical protein BWY95_02627 [Bacteroidetes bacterium ADurb.BinA104]